jgi:hypothetical protein
LYGKQVAQFCFHQVIWLLFAILVLEFAAVSGSWSAFPRASGFVLRNKLGLGRLTKSQIIVDGGNRFNFTGYLAICNIVGSHTFPAEHAIRPHVTQHA